MSPKKHIVVTSAWFPSDRSTSGVFVKEQAEALARAGHRVTAFIFTQASLKDWLRSLLSRDEERYDGSEDITFIRKHVVFPLPARFFQDPEAAVKRFIINRVLRRMKRYIAANGRPDVLHHHCLSDNSYLVEAISRKFGIPYVFTEYSNYFSYAELNKFNWFETFEDHRRFVRNAAARIAATAIRASGYESIFDSPFIVIPNLVVDLFAAPLVDRPPNLPFTFICVALLDRRKRQDVLLKAFASAFRDKNARLLVVGNGNLETAYKNLAVELGIGNQVTFTGKQDRIEVRRLFDESHVKVLASDQETFAIVLAEAMFRGIPVISTMSSGPEEVVTPETGVLVPKGDDAALAEQMQAMFEHYDRYDREKIRVFAMSRYSEQMLAARIGQVYEQVCSPKSSMQNP